LFTYPQSTNFIFVLSSYDILNPKAKKLLENLEALNLISIKKDSKKRFKEIVKQLRTKSTSTPSLEEITKEVESVRAKRHGN
jgi:hypothetical protein